VKCSHIDSAKPYFRFPSIVARAWATAELGLSLPGVVAQPPLSTKLPCIYADIFLSSTKLLAASDELKFVYTNGRKDCNYGIP
jgi:hypothetical protein